MDTSTMILGVSSVTTSAVVLGIIIVGGAVAVISYAATRRGVSRTLEERKP